MGFARPAARARRNSPGPCLCRPESPTGRPGTRPAPSAWHPRWWPSNRCRNRCRSPGARTPGDAPPPGRCGRRPRSSARRRRRAPRRCDAASTFSTLWRPRMGISPASISSLPSRISLSAAQAGAGRHLVPAAEPFHAGGGARSVADAHRVVGIEHGEVAGLLRLEQPSFGGGVVLERVVPVQMILRDVQRQADVRAKFRDGLQLKTGKFQHIPAVRARSFDHGGHRRPDVAAHLHRQAGVAQNVADQAGGGGFAVGSGDADGPALAETARPVPLRRSPARRAARAASSGGRSAGTSGESTIRPQPSNTSATAARKECPAAPATRARRAVRRAPSRSVARHAGAVAQPAIPPTPCRTSSSPRPGLCAAQLNTHRNFNVVSANSASTRPAIQKRAMIFDSVQPNASK